MDRETLSHYGWIVILTLILAVLLALATPFGNFVADGIKITAQGLFDTNKNAMDAAGIELEGQTIYNPFGEDIVVTDDGYYDHELESDEEHGNWVWYGQPYRGSYINYWDDQINVEIIFFENETYVVINTDTDSWWGSENNATLAGDGTLRITKYYSYEREPVVLNGQVSNNGHTIYFPEIDSTLTLQEKVTPRHHVFTEQKYVCKTDWNDSELVFHEDGSIEYTWYWEGEYDGTSKWTPDTLTYYQNYIYDYHWNYWDGWYESNWWYIWPDGTKILDCSRDIYYLEGEPNGGKPVQWQADPVSYDPEDFTWEEIKAICDAGKAEEYFELGDKKSFTTSEGITFVMEIIDFNKDEKADGTGTANITWMAKYASIRKGMEPTDKKYVTWEDCHLRNWLQGEFYETLPEALQNAIVPVTKTYAYSKTTYTTTDTTWIPSVREYNMNRYNSVWYETSEAIYLDKFGESSFTKFYCDATGARCGIWLRTSENGRFEVMSGGQLGGTINTNYTNGIILGFCT